MVAYFICSGAGWQEKWVHCSFKLFLIYLIFKPQQNNFIYWCRKVNNWFIFAKIVQINLFGSINKIVDYVNIIVINSSNLQIYPSIKKRTEYLYEYKYLKYCNTPKKTVHKSSTSTFYLNSFIFMLVQLKIESILINLKL